MTSKFPGFLLAGLFLGLLSCNPNVDLQEEERIPEAIALTGEPLYSGEPSPDFLDRYKQYKVDYLIDTTNVEKLIWFGRFAGYIGGYKEAIAIYSRGISLFPDDARLFRHRGHRYISIRELDKAILDLSHAAEMVEDLTDEIEPDGIPNEMNIPVSTLHGNIWYHLGLAYYLKQDMEQALEAYKRCLATSQNDDNIVSSTHWIYMILRRLGRVEEADTYLEVIQEDMNVIENFSYHQACLFYKGNIKVKDLQKGLTDSSSGDALRYALGNWYLYNGDQEKAKVTFRKMLDRETGWASFGYIAAESDWKSFFMD